MTCAHSIRAGSADARSGLYSHLKPRRSSPPSSRCQRAPGHPERQQERDPGPNPAGLLPQPRGHSLRDQGRLLKAKKKKKKKRGGWPTRQRGTPFPEYFFLHQSTGGGKRDDSREPQLGPRGIFQTAPGLRPPPHPHPVGGLRGRSRVGLMPPAKVPRQAPSPAPSCKSSGGGPRAPQSFPERPQDEG